MAFLDTHGLQTFKGLLDNLFSKKLNTTLKGAANGLAELDSSGKVPSSQLPSYVDDVLEYAKQSDFPATGETGKIYVAKDTNKTYRWSGSAYVEISASLALGETSSTAYRGDRGKTAYDHAAASGSAFTSGLYKITTNAQGHVTAATAVAKADITALGIPGSDTNNSVMQTATATDADYEVLFSGTADNTTRTEGARKTNTLTYNPNTKELLTGGSVDGFTLNAASAKAVDSSISASSTSVNLPTSAAVASFVEGKGYKTTDTKNTAGSTDTSSKIYIVGATSQAANPQTYSHDTAYVGTDGCLYSGGVKVLTAHQDISGKKNTQSAVSDPSASGTSTTFIKTISQNAQGVITATKASIPLNDTLTSSSTLEALTAKQGKILNDNKAPTASPVFTGSISMGRAASTTVGTNSVAIGTNVEASGMYSFSIGNGAKATAGGSHAEGSSSTASEIASHAEGMQSVASGNAAHAEGYTTTASGNYSHAEGHESTASGDTAHAEGYQTKAVGTCSHAEGSSSEANGNYSHVEGYSTISSHRYQHVFGKLNVPDPNPNNTNSTGTYIEMVGNGSNDSNRSNARTLDWYGNERLKGDIYVNCNADSSGGTALGAAVTALNSKTAYEANTSVNGVVFRKFGSVCVVSINKAFTGEAAGTTVFTIPAGFVPRASVYLHLFSRYGNFIGCLEFGDTGAVKVVGDALQNASVATQIAYIC